jgi:hypothetical protein
MRRSLDASGIHSMPWHSDAIFPGFGVGVGVGVGVGLFDNNIVASESRRV